MADVMKELSGMQTRIEECHQARGLIQDVAAWMHHAPWAPTSWEAEMCAKVKAKAESVMADLEWMSVSICITIDHLKKKGPDQQ